MAERHVHWEDEIQNEDSDGASFVPPSPSQSSSAFVSNADDDDSLADSPSPPTPVITLAPFASNVDNNQARQRLRTVPRSILVTSRSHQDAHIRSPDSTVGRFGESPTGSDPFAITGVGRSLPPISLHGQSPRKTSAPTLPRHSRHSSVSAPGLHSLLIYTPSGRTPTLVWNVGDKPSSSTVLMTSPNGDGLNVPVPASALYSPATNPPQIEMRIHCVSHSLWNPILVHAAGMQTPQEDDLRRSGRMTPSPSSGHAFPSPAAYVTVKDIIRSIYQFLHTLMNANEYAALASLPIPGFQESVAQAFYERCESEECQHQAHGASPEWRIKVRIGSLFGGNKALSHQIQSPTSSTEGSGANLGAGSARSGGLRRLDCLLGQTRYLGLTNVPGASFEWYMNVTESSP